MTDFGLKFILRAFRKGLFLLAAAGLTGWLAAGCGDAKKSEKHSPVDAVPPAESEELPVLEQDRIAAQHRAAYLDAAPKPELSFSESPNKLAKPVQDIFSDKGKPVD